MASKQKHSYNFSPRITFHFRLMLLVALAIHHCALSLMSFWSKTTSPFPEFLLHLCHVSSVFLPYPICGKSWLPFVLKIIYARCYCLMCNLSVVRLPYWALPISFSVATITLHYAMSFDHSMQWFHLYSITCCTSALLCCPLFILCVDFISLCCAPTILWHVFIILYCASTILWCVLSLWDLIISRCACTILCCASTVFSVLLSFCAVLLSFCHAILSLCDLTVLSFAFVISCCALTISWYALIVTR